jgi:plastocyanin
LSLPYLRSNVVVFAIFLVLSAFTGCKPDAALEKGETIGRGTQPATAAPPAPASVVPEGAAPVITLGPSALGSVGGFVNFTGKAPAPVRIDTSMDPACSLGSTGQVFSEQFAVNSGKLANVFVYVKSGPPAAMARASNALTGGRDIPVVLDQVGCRYAPHVVGVVKGGFVEFRNSDLTMHNIHTMPRASGNNPVDVSQGPHGAPETKQFNAPELMIPVRCNNHPWMSAFINVAPTAFFAVTDKSGHFNLFNLPAGTYTIGAVQEKLGEQTLTVTVTPNRTAKADFSFQP